MADRNVRLCELNAIEQVVNVCHTTMVKDAWERGQKLSVHAWCYSLANGHMNDLGMHVDSSEALWPSYEAALAAPGRDRAASRTSTDVEPRVAPPGATGAQGVARQACSSSPISACTGAARSGR